MIDGYVREQLFAHLMEESDKNEKQREDEIKRGSSQRGVATRDLEQA